ncbi:hypothetical protein J1N35_044464 [Gossypium stocksii]|uniref:Uncharacterized protein n=1 Tax=Gossypium stocksii TaxID=47602 RepID=A0A9D3U9I6_9ROSI|nr:hypothetical protein J1N35_044464 [Gossypium stocksii]
MLQRSKGENSLGAQTLKRFKMGLTFCCNMGNSGMTDSTAKEQGCTINKIILQNKILLIENRRLRLENDELNIDEM